MPLRGLGKIIGIMRMASGQDSVHHSKHKPGKPVIISNHQDSGAALQSVAKLRNFSLFPIKQAISYRRIFDNFPKPGNCLFRRHQRE